MMGPQDVNHDRAIGLLSGKLGAVEDRLNRLEGQIDDRLASLETKVDSVLATIAKATGERLIVGRVVSWACTVAGSLAVAAASWWHGHNTTLH